MTELSYSQAVHVLGPTPPFGVFPGHLAIVAQAEALMNPIFFVMPTCGTPLILSPALKRSHSHSKNYFFV